MASARTRVCVALACALAACASDPPNRIVAGHEGAPGVQRVLLCPPNLVLGLNAELQAGAEPADREVGAYLESRGLTVSRIGFIAGRQDWKLSVSEAKAAGALDGAVGVFARRLAQDFEFDAIVMPSLILHQTLMDANNASWDGVDRRLQVRNAPRGTQLHPVSGKAWVATLHVLVFSPAGAKIFEGRGGVDFLMEINAIQEGRKVRYEFRPNTSLFRDDAILRESVMRAFEPYLAAPSE